MLKIRRYPDKILETRCKDVSVVDSEIRRILDDMVTTMHSAGGLGLAAPQVGLDMRLIVAGVEGQVLQLVNPEIIEGKGKSILEEGCLSLPNINIKMKRAQEIMVSALDKDARRKLIKAEGVLSHILQHEIDHLNGKLLIDYLPFYKKIIAKRRLMRYY